MSVCDTCALSRQAPSETMAKAGVTVCRIPLPQHHWVKRVVPYAVFAERLDADFCGLGRVRDTKTRYRDVEVLVAGVVSCGFYQVDDNDQGRA